MNKDINLNTKKGKEFTEDVHKAFLEALLKGEEVD